VNYHQSLKVCITVLVLQLNKDLNRRKRSLWTLESNRMRHLSGTSR
jgi:hypothetical protein